MNVNWKEIRKKEYPTLDENDLTYLMAASASPLSKSARDSAVSYFDEMHVNGDINFERFQEDMGKTRNMVSDYLGCKPEEIAFLINTSSGITTLANLFTKERGEILYPSVEFPASIHIFKRMGYPCKKIEDRENVYHFEDFKAQLTNKSKYMVHSQVQSQTGFKQDLNELGDFCMDNDLISIVNATQAFGSFDIDVERQNIDILVSNGLKWLGCGYGIGMLYIKEDLIKERELPFTSWLSVEDPFGMDNDNLNVIHKVSSMDAFGGCPNCAALYSLKGGLEMIKTKVGQGDLNQGVKQIEERITKLTSELVKELEQLNMKIITPLDLKYRSGIITIEHQNAARINENLKKQRVYASLKRYPKSDEEILIRFAINHYNNSEDIKKLIESLRKELL